MILGAFGKYMSIFAIAQKAVADIAGDPALKGTAVAQTLSKIATIGGEVETDEPEVEAVVELCLQLFPHTSTPAPAK